MIGIELPANKIDLVYFRIKGVLKNSIDTNTKIQPKELSQPSARRRAKERPKVRKPTDNELPIIIRQRRNSSALLRKTTGIK